MKSPAFWQPEKYSEHEGVSITFSFNHPAANSVYIAGTFNDWNPHAVSLHAAGSGKWMKELHLDPGIYEYRFIVDGEWMVDPSAIESVPNPFGGMNSQVKVTQHRAQDQMWRNSTFKEPQSNAKIE